MNIDLIEQMTSSMEQNENILFLQNCVQQSLNFMTQLSRVPEEELFKICLEFWHFFCLNTMMKVRGNQFFGGQGAIYGLESTSSTLMPNSFLHFNVYPQILESVRLIIIDQMAKPKEVLVVIDENGEAVEENIQDTETITIYETMRETLIYLTNIDTPAMDRVIQ
jgi:exportin-1